MKKRLTTIIKELEDDPNEVHYESKSFEEVLEICKDKFDPACFTGAGKNTWVAADCQDDLKDALRIPEIAQELLQAIVVRLAPNPSYVYCYVANLQKTVPVVVPKKMQKRMLHKKIKVQRIQDESGETFRYEQPRIHP